MVSEDSDQVVSGLLPIHRLRDLRDLDQTISGPMSAVGDHLHTSSEPLEVPLLHGMHRIPPEERNHRLQQLSSPPHHVVIEVLAMVVVATVCDDLSNSEEDPELVEAADAALTLCHRELVRHLEAGSVASSTRPIRLPDESDREASFSVYETDHPSTSLDQSFLLIFRTRHVVTMVNVPSDAP